MLKFRRTISLLLALLLFTSLVLSGCGAPKNNQTNKKIPKPPSDKQVKIGIALSSPGRGDNATNDAALAGLERAKNDLGIEYKVLDPGELVDEEETIRYLADNNFDLVIAVGFPMVKPMEKVADDFPDINFAIIDDVVNKPNVTSITFREQEGSFLAGALAGTITKSNVTGFMGGADLDLIHKYEAGFKQGVAYINDTERKNVKVLSGYLGLTTDAFKDPTLGTNMASLQFSQGADVVYHAARTASQGIIDAAKAGNRLVIGSDINQNNAAPGIISASMVKHTDEAVYQTISKLIKGELPHGVISYGLIDNGVSLEIAPGAPQNLIDKINVLRAKIINGEIKVSDKVDDNTNAKVQNQVTQIIPQSPATNQPPANHGQNNAPNVNPGPTGGQNNNGNPGSQTDPNGG